MEMKTLHEANRLKWAIDGLRDTANLLNHNATPRDCTRLGELMYNLAQKDPDTMQGIKQLISAALWRAEQQLKEL